MATGYLHAAIETDVAGNETNTPTLGTKVIYIPALSFTPALNPTPMDRNDEIRNVDQPLAYLEETHAPTWDLSTRMYPDSLGFMLWLMLGDPTTTQGDGASVQDPDSVAIPVSAYRHVWTAPFGPSGASPYTAQFQPSYADQSVFFKLKGAACQALGLESPETGGGRISASGPALYMERQSDPSLSPSYEALTIRPFTRGNLTLPTWLSGTGTHEDFTLNIANPVEVVRSLGIASKFPDVMEKAETPIMFTGSLPQRQLDADDYNALKAATGFSATARWVSESIIGSSYPYKLYVQFDNAQYTAGGPAALENRRRHGATFDWAATYDGSGASVTVTLVNATASFA